MADAGIVIVGAGQTGGRAALTLRSEGYDGPVTLIGAEPGPPYERPPLSKAFLTGKATEREFLVADEERLGEARIDLRHSTLVTRIDRESRAVVLEGGESVPYARLLIATGRRPRRLPVPGAELAGVHYLRDLADSRALAAELRPGARLVVVGGGFIGLEVAASAVGMGARVTVVEAGPRLMMRAVPEEMAAFLTERHRAEGVSIRCEAQVAAFEGGTRVEGVALADGSRLAADAVVIGIGAEPCDELARLAGLAVDRGILVDETLATDDPAIFAAGDAVAFPHPIGEGRLRLEAWRNAEDQGALAARNMLGARLACRFVPWFWSDQYDLTLQITGFPDLARRSIPREVGAEGRLILHTDEAGRLVAASGVGPMAVLRDVRVAQKLIERGAPVSAAQLADPSVALRSLLKAA